MSIGIEGRQLFAPYDGGGSQVRGTTLAATYKGPFREQYFKVGEKLGLFPQGSADAVAEGAQWDDMAHAVDYEESMRGGGRTLGQAARQAEVGAESVADAAAPLPYRFGSGMQDNRVSRGLLAQHVMIDQSQRLGVAPALPGTEAGDAVQDVGQVVDDGGAVDDAARASGTTEENARFVNEALTQLGEGDPSIRRTALADAVDNLARAGHAEPADLILARPLIEADPNHSAPALTEALKSMAAGIAKQREAAQATSQAAAKLPTLDEAVRTIPELAQAENEVRALLRALPRLA